MAGSVTHAFHTGDRQNHCARSHSKHSISPYCVRAVFFPLCFLELLPEDTTVSKQLLQFRQQAANIVCVPPPPPLTPPPPAPPTRTHPRHPTLGEKYKASLVWEHRDLSDAALYHSILPLSHNDCALRHSVVQWGRLTQPTDLQPAPQSLAWRTNNTLYSQTRNPIQVNVNMLIWFIKK